MRTSTSADVIYNAFTQLNGGKQTNDKNVVLKDVSWRFTGTRNSRCVSSSSFSLSRCRWDEPLTQIDSQVRCQRCRLELSFLALPLVVLPPSSRGWPTSATSSSSPLHVLEALESE